MPLRIASTLSLLSFAACLVAGGFAGGNGFATVVWRALSAMACTFVVGLVVGLMAQKMLEENLAAESKRLKEAAEATLKAVRQREPILEVGGDDPLPPPPPPSTRAAASTSDKPRRPAAAA